jgi:hypothetical protein
VETNRKKGAKKAAATRKAKANLVPWACPFAG